MTSPFSADEIFEIAQQIEMNADAFYRRAAHETRDERLKKRLLGLAAMENQHEKVLASMREELSGQEKEPTFPDPWGEAALYLRGIANGSIFDVKKDPTEWITGKETSADILKAAIEQEKNSVIFYLGMKEMVPEDRGRHRVDAIIREEMGHIATLSADLRASLE